MIMMTAINEKEVSQFVKDKSIFYYRLNTKYGPKLE